MRAQRKWSAGLSLALGLLLGVTAAMQPVGASALPYLDVEKTGTLTVELDKKNSADYAYTDLLAAEFPCTVYRLASITRTGAYTAEPGLEELQDLLNALKGGGEDNKDTVDRLRERALELLGLSATFEAGGDAAEPGDAGAGGAGTEPGDGGTGGDGTGTPEPGATAGPGPGGSESGGSGSEGVPGTAGEGPGGGAAAAPWSREITVRNGASDELEELPSGLYLLYTPDVVTYAHIYSFEAAILSMPGMFYADGAADPEVEYEYTAYLKPEQKARPGKLRIVKDLLGMDTANGTATFVFHVEAELDGKTVLDRYVTLDFTAAGQQEVEIEGIPVGARVTVTEVYSGGAYSVQSDGSVTVEIVPKLGPEEAPLEEMPELSSGYARYDEENTAEVTFVNEPGRRIPGASVVNHYEHGETGYKGPVQEWSDGSDAKEP